MVIKGHKTSTFITGTFTCRALSFGVKCPVSLRPCAGAPKGALIGPAQAKEPDIQEKLPSPCRPAHNGPLNATVGPQSMPHGTEQSARQVISEFLTHEVMRYKTVAIVFLIFILYYDTIDQGFPGGTMVKNPPANARDIGDSGLIPGSGRFPGVENDNPLQYLAWRIPWTEEPDGRAMGSQRVGTTEHLSTHARVADL